IIDSYFRVSHIVFHEIINRPEVLAILKKATSSDENIRNESRQELFLKLTPVYQRLKNLNVRQFHFHLPDNTSFLRFHRPSKFGDDLTDVRYSIKQTNSQLKTFSGFEEGRIKNGFRYVFPIISPTGHLGSVEISLNFKAIEQEMMRLFGKEYNFIISRTIVDQKVFESEKSNYKLSDVSDDYMLETPEEINKTHSRINKLLKSQIASKLLEKSSFAVETANFEDKYIVTFLPVANVEGQKVAYLISYDKDDTIKRYYFEFYLSLFIGIMGLLVIYFLSKKLKSAYETIREQAILDGLTEIPNRRYFSERVSTEFKLSQRSEKPLSVIMCDVDNFKAYNDTYGHGKGDQCLKKVAQTLQSSLKRPGDFCARYGGEEFVVLLPNTDLDGALNIAEKIRSNIEKMEISHEKSLPAKVVTLSLGVTTSKKDNFFSQEELVKQADMALYRSKELGRNQAQSFNELA
ncbi:MAG: diguanylate cyclase, partial [Desulfobacula sp.]|nr:diguanylate cyclase [Desulfobacula sp.]